VRRMLLLRMRVDGASRSASHWPRSDGGMGRCAWRRPVAAQLRGSVQRKGSAIRGGQLSRWRAAWVFTRCFKAGAGGEELGLKELWAAVVQLDATKQAAILKCNQARPGLCEMKRRGSDAH